MFELTSMKFTETKSMQDHIVEMTNITARLKTLGMAMDDSFLIQFILNSLPPKDGLIQINYNSLKDKWNVSELSSMLAQKEARLKKQEGSGLSIYLINSRAFKVKPHKFKKKLEPNKVSYGDRKGKTTIKCCFCNKEGHLQKDCQKRMAWLEKKVIML